MNLICVRQNKNVTTFYLLWQLHSESGDNKFLINISYSSPIDTSLTFLKNNYRLHCCEKLKSHKARKSFKYDLIYDTLRSLRIYCKWKLHLSLLFILCFAPLVKCEFLARRKCLLIGHLSLNSLIKYTNTDLIFLTLRRYLSVNTFTFNTIFRISASIIWIARFLCIEEMSLHYYIIN